MRRILIAVLVPLLVIAGLAAAAVAGGGAGHSTVTRARLERALPVVFSNLYVSTQSHVYGRTGLTPASLHATAMCDKHGPDVPDVGPGGDWTCLMGWKDPELPMPAEGYGKFEVNVHSNDCFTAGGPSKLTGFLTVTDQHGHDVTNPLFEFDGCFDPGADNTPTGVSYPSVLNVTSTALTPDKQGRVPVQVTCGTGSDGCAGTMEAAVGNRRLATVPFHVREEGTGTVLVPTPLPAGTQEVTFTPHLAQGVAGSDSTTVPVQKAGTS